MYPEEVVRLAKVLRADGYSYRKIAEKIHQKGHRLYGVESVRCMVHPRAPLPKRPRRPRAPGSVGGRPMEYDHRDIMRVKILLFEGRTTREVARMMGIPKSTVHRLGAMRVDDAQES